MNSTSVPETADLAANWLLAIIFVVALALFVRQLWRSLRLAIRMRASARFGAFGAIALVVSIVARNFWKVWSDRRLFELTRRRIEFEIFFPKPQWRWPMRDDEESYVTIDVYDPETLERYTTEDFRDNAAAVKEKAREKHKKEWRRWRDKARDARGRTFTITLPTAGELNARLSEIKLYFDTLKILKVDTRDLEFLCKLKVDVGFLASQHLLTGLLVRFNAKWGHIIKGFERDTRQVRQLIGPEGEQDETLSSSARDFRQIQSFIYHCWLLWGPSVPVCVHECEAWKADYTTLQYGYGDENNAIEIVGEYKFVYAQLCDLLGLECENGRIGPRIRDGAGRPIPAAGEDGAMAVPASVRGRLQYSSIASLRNDQIPAALRQSWGGGQDERPILFLSKENSAGEQTPDGDDNYMTDGWIRPEGTGSGDARRSLYYSAYFWVMFVILDREGRVIHPHAERPGASSMLWKDSIPFFEHGNLADAASCRFAKAQLAEKALSGLASMVADWEARSGGFPFRFSYVCAIDDPNCSKKTLAVEALQGGETVRRMIERRLGEEGPNSRIGRLQRDGIIDFKSHQPVGSVENHHSACQLPIDVGSHYETLDDL